MGTCINIEAKRIGGPISVSACYDNTQRHLGNVETLTTKEEVDVYDYTTGYPEKITF